MPVHRKAIAEGDSFYPLAIAGVRRNTEWRKRLLKNIQQARQAGRVQSPIYPNMKICGRNLLKPKQAELER